MISFISSLEIINAVTPDPVADVAAVISNGIKMLLHNGLNTFHTFKYIKYNSVFSNGPKSLPKNPHDCPILCS